jgi:hypothetical protein
MPKAKSTAVRGARQLAEAARRQPGETSMSRPGWTTVAIPTELYDDVKARQIPRNAKSVQSYVQFWVRVGMLVDQALADIPCDAKPSERVAAALERLQALRDGETA